LFPPGTSRNQGQLHLIINIMITFTMIAFTRGAA
jgi:hypothetical protein